jgi:hypothetical protein
VHGIEDAVQQAQRIMNEAERGWVSRRSGWLMIGEGRVARSCVRAHREFTGGCAAEAIKPSVIVFVIEPSNENISQDTGACVSVGFVTRKSTVHLLPRVWSECRVSG